MPMNFSGSNDAIRKLLEYKMQELMADRSLQRQMEYLGKSNELYGQRESERIKQQGQSEMDVAKYKHGLDMDKLAEETNAWLLRQSKIKQLQAVASTSNDPATRKAAQDALGKFADIFGGLAEDSIMGKPPDRARLGVISQFVDVNDALTYLNSVSASYRGAVTAGANRDRLALDKQKLGLEQEKFAQAKTQGPKGAKDINDKVAAKAKQVLAYLSGGKGDRLTLGSGDETVAPDKGPLLGFASEVQSRAELGEFSDATKAKGVLDILDLIYRDPEKAKGRLAAKDWLKNEEAKRAGAKAPNIPADAPTATNPQTGERVAYVNGQWIKIS